MKSAVLASTVGAAILAAGAILAAEFGDWSMRAERSTSLAQGASATLASQEQGISSENLQNASLQTVSLKVDKMYCPSCPFMVRRALERVEGVRQAHVDYRSKMATVAFDPAVCDAAKLMTATAAIGYPSSAIR